MIRHLAQVPVLAAVLAALASAPAQGALPDGFADEPVAAGLSSPAALTHLPDGRALVAELSTARIRMVRQGVVSTLGTVPQVRTGSERGLLGIAVDPAWPERPFLYVHSTSSVAFEIRVSRFTATGDLDDTAGGALAIDPASRHEVVTGLPDQTGIHNGGTVRFGPDRMLYVSLGEDADDCAAQNPASLKGAILRLDVSRLPAGPGGPPPRDSVVAAGNPFAQAPSVAQRLVWTYGLRNPFRFSIDPATGALYVGDVGQNQWEEMDEIAAPGANCGWPWLEGHAPYDLCQGSPGTTLAPIHVYDHARPGQEAIIAGPVLRLGGMRSFPREYDGSLFFSDYYKGDLVRLTRAGGGWTVAAPVPGQPDPAYWGTGYSFVADWAIGPDGALWYCRQSTGEVRRIVHQPAIPPLAAPAPSALRPDAWYDLQGRRIDRPGASGIYFSGGRRVAVRR